MFKKKHRQLFVKSVLLLLVCTLLGQPIAVAAQPLPEPPHSPYEALTAAGDMYLTSAGRAMQLSMELIPLLGAIRAAPLAQVSEPAVVQARSKALALAEQNAIVLGATHDLANRIAALGNDLPVAFNVADRAALGLPYELRQDLLNKAGLSAAQVDALEDEYQALAAARLDVAAHGLPQALQDELLAAGFTAAEIEQLTDALAVRGLADTGLASSMAQFRATQAEWATARTRALVAYVQLLGKQIAVRQYQGTAPRGVTDTELKELANDELRLLIHVAHLDEQWGSDPRLESGEGDWWFIERYAGRAADRLDALILDSQNRGLVAELLLARQMQTLAITARSGGAAYAKTELDMLAALLGHQTGQITYVSTQRSKVQGWAKLAAQVAVEPAWREQVWWPVDTADQQTALNAAREWLNAAGVVNLTADFSGVIEEANENNNRKDLLFAAGLPYFSQLELDALQAGIDILSQFTPQNVLVWFYAILTGDTDDPALIAANIGFSMLPIIGVIPDIYTLATDPSVIMKAFSIIGIIGSIGDLLELLPGAQPLGTAAVFGDAASAALKPIYRASDAAFRLILDGLKLSDAFKVIVEFLQVAIKPLIKLVGELGDDLVVAIQKLTTFFKKTVSLWQDFVYFVKKVGGATLVLTGFDEGSWLVGGILRRLNSELSPSVIRALDSIGDDLAKASIELGDEAADGLGLLAKQMDEAQIKQLLKVTTTDGLDNLKHALAGLKNWDEFTQTGFGKLAKSGHLDEREIRDLLIIFSDNPTQARNAFGLLGNSPDATAILSKFRKDGVEFVGKFADEGILALKRPPQAFERTPYQIKNNLPADTIDYAQDFINLMKRPGIDQDELRVFITSTNFKDFGWLHVTQAWDMRQVAKKHNLDIYIAGRWSDSPAEAARRIEAWNTLIQRPDVLQEATRRNIIPIPNKKGDLKWDEWDNLLNEYRPEVGLQYGIDPHQVKISSGGLEADTYIPPEQWYALSSTQQAEVAGDLRRAIYPDKPELWDAVGSDGKPVITVDFYQALDRMQCGWEFVGLCPGWPDPLEHIPSSSIGFRSWGGFEHTLFAGIAP